MKTDPLGNPAWTALRGPHAHFAQGDGRAVRYHPDVAPFHALSDPRDPGAWADLAALIEPGTEALVPREGLTPPPGWTVVASIDGVQLADVAVKAAGDPEAVPLTGQDVTEMLDLAQRTRPGPFRPRTVEFGGYLGVRRGGALIAMAGERMRLPGWTEISAVCTDPAHRGQGLAARLVRAVAAGIRDRGEIPFLHAAADNTSAIRLYESLGFERRRGMSFVVLRPPGSQG